MLLLHSQTPQQSLFPHDWTGSWVRCELRRQIYVFWPTSVTISSTTAKLNPPNPFREVGLGGEGSPYSKHTYTQSECQCLLDEMESNCGANWPWTTIVYLSVSQWAHLWVFATQSWRLLKAWRPCWKVLQYFGLDRDSKSRKWDFMSDHVLKNGLKNGLGMKDLKETVNWSIDGLMES